MKTVIKNLTLLFIAAITSCDLPLDDSFCTANDSIESPCYNSELVNGLFSTNNYPVFKDVAKINVIPYIYYANETNYSISGDSLLTVISEMESCCNILTILDEYGSAPIFEWEDIENELIAISIFNTAVNTSGSSITNINSIIWTWNNSIKPLEYINGKPRVYYNNGVPVIDGKLQYNSAPIPLENNKLYYWMIWAWNETGTKVVASSSATPFKVREFSTPIQDIRSINGYWVLNNVKDLLNSSFDVNEFNINTINIKGNCTDYTCVINDSIFFNESLPDGSIDQLNIDSLELIFQEFNITNLENVTLLPCQNKIIIHLEYDNFYSLEATYVKL